MIPCAFALLTNKTITMYRCLLSELKDGASRIKLILKPKLVMLDFEQATINALNFHFPGVLIKLCFFHFSQNVFKKIVEVGLKKEYKEDDKLKLWVKTIIALALIPTEEVLDAFVRLSEDEIVDSYDLSVFLDYITINYVDDDEALFPISFWNHWDNEEDRTHNKIEGYNLKLNLYLHSHPNIWKFII